MSNISNTATHNKIIQLDKQRHSQEEKYVWGEQSLQDMGFHETVADDVQLTCLSLVVLIVCCLKNGI